MKTSHTFPDVFSLRGEHALITGAGTGIIGSCCGSTPEHTREIRRMVDLMGKQK